MAAELQLTVREALQRPLFQNAQVVAGASGLDNRIRWVHILETPSFETLIHGQEMILTTGISFKLNGAASVTFLDNLIKQNAACLCIEIGEYFEQEAVSEALLTLAEQHRLPLILFPSTVRFVDITQDLHSLIINRHHQMLQDLERVSREFHRLALTSQGTLHVLKLLHKSTHARIVYLPHQNKPIAVPPLTADEQDSLLRVLETCRESLDSLKPDAAPFTLVQEGWTLVCKPVGVLDQTWAYLVMRCPQPPQEYDYLLLDSASLSVAQELLRNRYMEERKLFSENLWVDELMSGRFTDEQQIRALIAPGYKSLNELQYRVCLVEITNLYEAMPDPEGSEWEAIRLHLSLILRSAFEKQGYRPLITRKNNRLAVIALDLKAKPQSKARLQLALNSLRDLQSDEKLHHLQLLFGISQPYKQLKQAQIGYEEAVQALSLQACFEAPMLFFEELGVYQLLLHLNDGHTLQAFVRHYIGPLLDHDQAKGSELLTTLRVYLDHDGSKQLAAQKLFIVRQSLYYRLEKIAELLGEHFMSPENRISIQVALRAYQLLQASNSAYTSA